MRKILLAVFLAVAPILCMANQTLVANMLGQTMMQIIMQATTCKGGPIAIFIGPDGKNIDETCNVKINTNTVTMIFAGYGKPLQIPRAQFRAFDTDHLGGNDQETSKGRPLAGPQNNAVRSAQQYLGFQGFSRKGLIQQLSSPAGDNYEIADATIAVDSLNINWNNEAARSAKQYLDMQGFSCKGLIRQLSSSAGSGYTVEQAKYGARQAGACPN